MKHTIIHWKKSVDILSKHPKTSAQELAELLDLDAVITSRLKTSFHRFKRNQTMKANRLLRINKENVLKFEMKIK